MDFQNSIYTLVTSYPNLFILTSASLPLIFYYFFASEAATKRARIQMVNQDYKNIVIIGAGGAGAATVNSLAKKLPVGYRLVVVCEREFAYWPVGALRAAIVPGFEDKVVAPLDNFLQSPNVLLAGTQALKIDALEKKVLLSKKTSIGSEISYEYLVVATGSTYLSPCRPPKEAQTVQDAKNFLRQLQKDIESSSSFLIVGGGPVGIEMVGEISEYYGSKKSITLVHSENSLLSRTGFKRNGLPAKALETIQKTGTKVILGQRVNLDGLKTGKLPKLTTFTLENGEKVEADFLFIASGTTPNADLVKDLIPENIDGKTGQVNVKPDLTLGSNSFSNIYVVGDAAHLPPSATYMTAEASAGFAASNILASIKSSKTKPFKPMPEIMFMSFGSKSGLGYGFGFNFPAIIVSMVKSKALFTPKFLSSYNAK